jgi:hypothetical protein
MDIKRRSRHYSPQMHADIEARTADQLDDMAEGWRLNAIADGVVDLGPDWVAKCWAIAAYFQYRADRKRNPEHYAV